MMITAQQSEISGALHDVLTDTSFRILPIEPALIEPMMPYIGPHLAAGAAIDPDFDYDDARARVMSGLTQVWAVWRGPRVVAAFCTTFVTNGDELAMDIHGMGGEGVRDWGDLAVDLMLEWSAANKANKILFRGRRCLARVWKSLGNVKALGLGPDGVYHFERSL